MFSQVHFSQLLVIQTFFTVLSSSNYKLFQGLSDTEGNNKQPHAVKLVLGHTRLHLTYNKTSYNYYFMIHNLLLDTLEAKNYYLHNFQRECQFFHL